MAAIRSPSPADHDQSMLEKPATRQLQQEISPALWRGNQEESASRRSIFWCDLAHLNKSLTERIAPSSVNTSLLFALIWCSPH